MRLIQTFTLLTLLLLQGCSTKIAPNADTGSPEETALLKKWFAKPQLEPYDIEDIRRRLVDMQEPMSLTNGRSEYSSAYRLLFSPAYGFQDICVRIEKHQFLITLAVKVTIPAPNSEGRPGRLVYSHQSLLTEKDFEVFERHVSWLHSAPPEPDIAKCIFDAPSCIIEMSDLTGDYLVVKRTNPGVEQGRDLKKLSKEIREKENPAFDADDEMEIQKHFVALIKWCANKTELELLKIYARQ